MQLGNSSIAVVAIYIESRRAETQNMLVSIEFSNWKVEFNDNTIVIVLGISTIIGLNRL